MIRYGFFRVQVDIIHVCLIHQLIMWDDQGVAGSFRWTLYYTTLLCEKTKAWQEASGGHYIRYTKPPYYVGWPGLGRKFSMSQGLRYGWNILFFIFFIVYFNFSIENDDVLDMMQHQMMFWTWCNIIIFKGFLILIFNLIIVVPSCWQVN